MRIWKFQIAITDTQTVMMPDGAQVLDVQMQGDVCCLWALCDERAGKAPRRFAIYGTGHPIPDEPGEFLATFQAHGGTLVFHVFEIAGQSGYRSGTSPARSSV